MDIVEYISRKCAKEWKAEVINALNVGDKVKVETELVGLKKEDIDGKVLEATVTGFYQTFVHFRTKKGYCFSVLYQDVNKKGNLLCRRRF
ncbi:ribosomal protein L19 [Lachnospiraceae bacterium PM6-15]|uniref:hypothetical protein n=1 Tax=Ohessyouella blattaphilus TaxID=2949333 RepID=UPI003E318405